MSGTLSYIAILLSVVGSLGLFLFGMKLLSESLQKLAGDKIRNILNAITGNKWKGFSTGLILTSGIQSSSATTIMLVSFVNAGLLSVAASIPVILGANIGTTITGWFVFLFGFKMQVASFALPLMGIAIPLYFIKRKNLKDWGEFLIGISLLFLALQFLQEIIPDFEKIPTIISLLRSFSEYSLFSDLLFVVAGMVITMLLQSSSATTTLTLVLASNGWIDFSSAAAMVIGENIGTTITANIAAIIGNRSSKQSARAHFIVNLIGGIWAFIFLQYLLQIVDLAVFRIEGKSAFESFAAIPLGLVVFHSAFNIINSLLLIWFIPFITKATSWLVAQKSESSATYKLRYIDNTLFSTSELSIIQVRKEILDMCELAKESYTIIPQMLLEKKPKRFKKLKDKITENETISDQMEEEIGLYLSKAVEKNLSSKSSGQIKAMLKIIDEIESIIDYCNGMARNIEQKNEKNVWFDQSIRNNFTQMVNLVKQAIDNMIHELEKNNGAINLERAKKFEEDINTFRDYLRNQHYDSVDVVEYSYQAGVYYITLLNQSERIGDHIYNIILALDESQHH